LGGAFDSAGTASKGLGDRPLAPQAVNIPVRIVTMKWQFLCNSNAKETGDDHGCSGKHDVPFTPPRRVGSGHLKEVEDE
jgi:hypothetical protein